MSSSDERPARRSGYWASLALASVGLVLIGIAAFAGEGWLASSHPAAECGCPSAPGSNSTPCPLACSYPTAPWILWVVAGIGTVTLTGGLIGAVLLRRRPLPLPS